MLELIRTDSDHHDLKLLIQELDCFLKITDGAEHDFYNQFNHLDTINHFVIAYWNKKPAGCGAFKPFERDCAQIKRMFTKSRFRRKQIGANILRELELWAYEKGFKSCVLETGIRQNAAVNFYKINNYVKIENYGQYIGVDNSLCFKKIL